MTFLARFLLKEHVPAVHWACVSGGMIGALFIVRPGGSLSGWDALYPICMVIAYAAFQTLTSQMTRSEDPMTMHFYMIWIGTLGISLIVFDSWTLDLTQNQWMLLTLVGLMGSIAHYMLILAFAKTHASQLTPFFIFTNCFSTFAGWLFFQQVPVSFALLGMILIAICGVIAGIHMAYEQKLQVASIGSAS
ncbi:MAG: DMT family transporter [Limnohabitans sp.]|nr:DMT family transporter [Limnohabitans sp.]